MARSKILNKPVQGLSLGGKIKIYIINALYALYTLFFGKKYPLSFTEDPAEMTWKESLYLGYKYYYRSPDPEPQVIDIFKSHNRLNTPSLSSSNNAKLTVSIGGDLMPYAYINSIQCASLWEHCGPHFFNHDIVFANLETPIHTYKKASKVPEIMLNHMEFNADEEQFRIMNGGDQFEGFHVLSCANNHSLDKGVSGVRQTHSFLSKHQIKTVGINPNRSRGGDLALIRKKGITVGWFAFTFSFNHLKLPQNASYIANQLPLHHFAIPIFEEIETQVQKLREMGAEFIVGSFHMGNAYQPMPEQNMLLHILNIVAQTSLDLFVGSHPHNPQPCLVAKNKLGKQVPIIFSPGDFVAYDIYTYGHLAQTLSINLEKDSSGNVWVVDFKEIYYHMLLMSNRELQLIPFDWVLSDPNKWINKALNKEEIPKLIAFYNMYLKPFRISTQNQK